MTLRNFCWETWYRLLWKVVSRTVESVTCRITRGHVSYMNSQSNLFDPVPPKPNKKGPTVKQVFLPTECLLDSAERHTREIPHYESLYSNRSKPNTSDREKIPSFHPIPNARRVSFVRDLVDRTEPYRRSIRARFLAQIPRMTFLAPSQSF